jgi:hypothetical protein
VPEFNEVAQQRKAVSAIADIWQSSRPAASQAPPGGRGAQDLLQLAALVHLHHDVRAADEFALDVQLRNGRPVAEFLDGLADLIVLQHVHGLEVLRIHATGLEDLDRAARETALGKVGIALHEQHHVAILDKLLDALLNVAH